MTITTYTETMHGFEIDGVRYPTTFKPDDYIDPHVEDRGDGEVAVTYATPDWGHEGSPLDDDEAVEYALSSNRFDTFDPGDAMEWQDAGYHVRFVQYHSHGLVEYYRASGLTLGYVCNYCERTAETDEDETFFACPELAESEELDSGCYPEVAVLNDGSHRGGGWDVGAAGWVAVDPEALGIDDADRLDGIIDGMLEAHTDWANGNVYGVITETFEVDADGEATPIDHDGCWGIAGSKWTQAIVNEGAC